MHRNVEAGDHFGGVHIVVDLIPRTRKNMQKKNSVTDPQIIYYTQGKGTNTPSISGNRATCSGVNPNIRFPPPSPVVPLTPL